MGRAAVLSAAKLDPLGLRQLFPRPTRRARQYRRRPCPRIHTVPHTRLVLSLSRRGEAPCIYTFDASLFTSARHFSSSQTHTSPNLTLVQNASALTDYSKLAAKISKSLEAGGTTAVEGYTGFLVNGCVGQPRTSNLYLAAVLLRNYLQNHTAVGPTTESISRAADALAQEQSYNTHAKAKLSDNLLAAGPLVAALAFTPAALLLDTTLYRTDFRPGMLLLEVGPPLCLSHSTDVSQGHFLAVQRFHGEYHERPSHILEARTVRQLFLAAIGQVHVGDIVGNLSSQGLAPILDSIPKDDISHQIFGEYLRQKKERERQPSNPNAVQQATHRALSVTPRMARFPSIPPQTPIPFDITQLIPLPPTTIPPPVRQPPTNDEDDNDAMIVDEDLVTEQLQPPPSPLQTSLKSPEAHMDTEDTALPDKSSPHPLPARTPPPSPARSLDKDQSPQPQREQSPERRSPSVTHLSDIDQQQSPPPSPARSPQPNKDSNENTPPPSPQQLPEGNLSDKNTPSPPAEDDAPPSPMSSLSDSDTEAEEPQPKPQTNSSAVKRKRSAASKSSARKKSKPAASKAKATQTKPVVQRVALIKPTNASSKTPSAKTASQKTQAQPRLSSAFVQDAVQRTVYITKRHNARWPRPMQVNGEIAGLARLSPPAGQLVNLHIEVHHVFISSDGGSTSTKSHVWPSYSADGATTPVHHVVYQQMADSQPRSNGQPLIALPSVSDTTLDVAVDRSIFCLASDDQLRRLPVEHLHGLSSKRVLLVDVAEPKHGSIAADEVPAAALDALHPMNAPIAVHDARFPLAAPSQVNAIADTRQLASRENRTEPFPLTAVVSIGERTILAGHRWQQSIPVCADLLATDLDLLAHDASPASVVPYPAALTRELIISMAHGVTPLSVRSLSTVLAPITGQTLLIVAVPIHPEAAGSSLYLSDLGPESPMTDTWKYESVVLAPGLSAIIPPLTPFCSLTLEDSLMIRYSHLCHSSIERSVSAELDRAAANSPSSMEAPWLLLRAFIAQAEMLRQISPRMLPHYAPDLTQSSELRRFLLLQSYAILWPALYTTSTPTPAPNLLGHPLALSNEYMEDYNSALASSFRLCREIVNFYNVLARSFDPFLASPFEAMVEQSILHLASVLMAQRRRMNDANSHVLQQRIACCLAHYDQSRPYLIGTIAPRPSLLESTFLRRADKSEEGEYSLLSQDWSITFHN
uniref:Uncharacterized protein n=1 Tax=Mycena chlorophos TaxID=658473 RepID=A0ABQ0KUA0_MYCCL|nr:predicted protein [Mycena chlorophos]